MFFKDVNVYKSLQDEESKLLYEGRLKYAISRDMHAWFKTLHNLKTEYSGWDLYLLERDYKSEQKIILYGAGKLGIHAIHIFRNSALSDRIEAFADSNPDIIGKTIEGYLVISPDELIERKTDRIVVITSQDFLMQIYQMLAKRGFPQKNIFVPTMGRLTAGCGKQYFDLFEPLEEEVFVDAGAYDGNTAIQFTNWRKDFGYSDGAHIIAFEASEEAIKRCCLNVEQHGIDNFTIIKKGCYSKKGTISFLDDINSYAMASAHVSEFGNNTIETETIDNVLDGNKATFIKMDIEGSELEALKGAEKTLKEYKPRLAISMYHKPEDIIEIPSYILSVVPDYKLYLRHYTSDIWETILYAI